MFTVDEYKEITRLSKIIKC